jgi:hypothetical protein
VPADSGRFVGAASRPVVPAFVYGSRSSSSPGPAEVALPQLPHGHAVPIGWLPERCRRSPLPVFAWPPPCFVRPSAVATLLWPGRPKTTLPPQRPLPFRKDPRVLRARWNAPWTWTRLQGIEPRGNPCIHPPGVTPTIGADPLLGFHLPRVFPLPATTTPFTWSPLSHFPRTGTEATVSRVPQSVSEQEDWLVSLETADPSEVPVLVSPLPSPKRRRGGVSDPMPFLLG